MMIQSSHTCIGAHNISASMRCTYTGAVKELAKMEDPLEDGYHRGGSFMKLAIPFPHLSYLGMSLLNRVPSCPTCPRALR